MTIVLAGTSTFALATSPAMFSKSRALTGPKAAGVHLPPAPRRTAAVVAPAHPLVIQRVSGLWLREGSPQRTAGGLSNNGRLAS